VLQFWQWNFDLSYGFVCKKSCTLRIEIKTIYAPLPPQKKIPDDVIGIFHLHNPSGRTMALGVYSASNRNDYQEYFLGSKGGRDVGLTTLPPSCADCLNICEPQPPGTLRACPGL
jgi:hypothetical protein